MTSAPGPAAVADHPGSAERAAVSAAELELGVCLDRALARLLRWNRRNQPSPFGPGVLSALGTVVDSGRIRLGDLAVREGIAPASLTRSVALLEEHALLVRSTDPDDRRSVFVEATPHGVAFVEDRRRMRGEGLAVRLAPLTADEMAAMHAIVRAIDDLATSA